MMFELGALSIKRSVQRFVRRQGYLDHDAAHVAVPREALIVAPSKLRVEAFLSVGEEVEKADAHLVRFTFSDSTKVGCDALSPELRSNVHATEPRTQVIAPFQVMDAQRSGTQRSVAFACNPSYGQGSDIFMSPKLRDAICGSVFRKDVSPMVKQARNKLNCETREFCEVANAHASNAA
jgi:hypothetical protein